MNKQIKNNVYILTYIFLVMVVFIFLATESWAVVHVKQKDNLKKESDRITKRYSQDRVLVKFKERISPTNLGNSLAAAGVQQIKALRYTGVNVLKVVGDNKDIKVIVQALQESGVVEYAEPDYILSIDAIPSDPQFNELWGLHNIGQKGGKVDADIDAPEAWDINTGSPGIVVGVIDTGVDYSHVDLAANIWINPGEIPNNGIDDDGNGYVDDIHGIDAFNNDSDPYDDAFHGTHVSGTIGGAGNNGIGIVGVNWNVKIMALKFLNSGGSGYTSDAIECLNYAIMMKSIYGINLKLTNNSWGGGEFSQALYDAIKASGDAGMLFIAAAGNSANDNDANPEWGYPSSYHLPNIISVASTDRYDNLSGFSSFGASSVDLAAPGQDILSTIPKSIAGLYYSGIYNLIYFSFGFEGINGVTTRRSVMQKVLDYYGLQPTNSILIVDDDNGGIYESNYTDALTALGYTNYNVISVGSTCADGPLSGLMQGYDLVMWFTGSNSTCTLTTNDQIELATFLDNGGNLFITGQDIGYDLILMKNDPYFYNNYLKANYVSDFSLTTQYFGAGIFTGETIDLSLNCSESACNQFWIDTIEPLTGASPAFIGDIYAYLSGTSMATPHVSGAAALIWSQYPSYDHNQVKTLLLDTVDPIISLGGWVLSGGRLNVNNALSCIPRNVKMNILARGEGFNAYVKHDTIVSVMLADCATAINGATVQVTPTNRDTSFNLLDNGVAPDSFANDGIYSGTWMPIKAGPVILNIEAAGGFGYVSGSVGGDVIVIPDYYYDDQIQYNWIDATIGINSGITESFTYADIPIGFDFEFYGVSHNTVRVSAEGYLTFGSYSPYIYNSPIPARNIPNDVIAPFWGFWGPVNGGSVYYLLEGAAPNRRLTIEWQNVSSYYLGGTATFEVTLYEGSNDIIFQYQDVIFGDAWIDNGASATIGIELWDGTVGLQYSYNQPLIFNQSAILFSYNHFPKPDIKANGSNNPIFVTTSEPVNVTVALDPGDMLGVKGDWWVGALTPYGTYWVNPSLKWLNSNTPVSAGQYPFFNLSTMSLLNRTFPPGYYMFFFILDDNPDGKFDMTWHDYVMAGVSSVTLNLQNEVLPDFENLFRDKIRELMGK